MRAIGACVSGGLIGAVVAVVLFMGAQKLLPERFGATVLLFAGNDEIEAAQLRLQLGTTMSDPDFLPGVVGEASIPLSLAAELARSIRVEPATQSPTLTQLAATGHPPQQLLLAMDALAHALVEARRMERVRDGVAKLQQVEQLEVSLEQQRVDMNAVLQDIALPAWARSAAMVLGMLDAQRFGLRVRGQLALDGDSQSASKDAALAAQLETLALSVGGTPAVSNDVLDAARQRASIDEKLAQLLSIRQELLSLKASQGDLRVVRGAQLESMTPPHRHIAYAALFGGLLGGLSGLLVRLSQPAARPTTDGPMLESSLNVRVIGAVPQELADYTQRKQWLLVQTQPGHLAIDGLNSVRTGLRMLSSDCSRPGPVVMANADETNHACYILANLAMLDAEAGYRVLVVETEQGSSVLPSLFTTGTDSVLSTSMDAADLDSSTPDVRSNGRLRFVVADDEDRDGGPPVPGAFIGYFDRVYIRAHGVERAAALLDIYDDGTGVLVGSSELDIRQWRSARDRWRSIGDTLDGLIQCGHRIDERSYASSKKA